MSMSSSWARVRKIASSIQNSATKMARMNEISAAVQFVFSCITEIKTFIKLFCIFL